MIFQGQEFLEGGAWDDGAPLDWARLQTFQGIAHLYGDLIRLRRNWFGTTRGLRGRNVHVFHMNAQDKVLAFHRWHDGGARDDVVVVLNFGNRAYDSYTVGFPRAGYWTVRFNSDAGRYDGAFANHPSNDTVATPGSTDPMPCSGNVGIGSYSAVVLSQDA
jgi:1,4-alpha-glucan branching enzyme